MSPEPRSIQNMKFGNLSIKRNIFAVFTASICLVAAYLAPMGLARVIVAIGFVSLFLIDSKRERNTTMISAVFLIGVFGVSLFSLIPATFNLAYDLAYQLFFPHSKNLGLPWMAAHTQAFIGSHAERLVLIFAAFLILAHCITRFVPERQVAICETPLSRLPLPYILAASGAITTVLLALHYFASGSQLATLMRTIFYPAQVLLLLISLCQFLDNKNHILNLFLVLFYFFITSLIMLELRIPVFVVISLFLLLAYKKYINGHSVFKAGFGLLVICVVMIAVVHFGRYVQKVSDINSLKPPSEMISINWKGGARALYWKIIYRQIETGACLKSVVEQHWGETMVLRDQFFWLEALVPRIVWPEKPNLSLGHSYSYRYCGIPKANNGHSSAITLLGEPIIKGGALGLYVHGGILVIGLMIFSAFARRNGDAGAILCLSMLPWWINFEQHFGLYVANLVKFGMIILVTYIAILFIERYFVRRLDDANS